jgi:undecaprenyl-diphosphatase
MDLLWHLDQAVFRWVNQGWSNGFLDVVFRLATYLGVGTVQAAILLPLVVLRGSRSLAAKAAVSAIMASGWNLYVKSVIIRHRPSNLVETLVAPDERIYASSFASGHTTTAFAIATALVLALPSRLRWVGWLSMTLAALVGLSRIYRGVHWPTDVIAGASSGVAAALVVDLLAARLKNRETTAS